MGLMGGDDTLGAVLENLDKNHGLYDSIDLPKYKEYSPELYDNETANYQLLSEDPVLKSKQLEAAAKMSDLSNEGLSDADKAGFAGAREMGDQMARGKTEAAIADAQAKGVGGGGLEFALREMAGQEGARRAQDAGLQQSAARGNQRAQYLQAAANQMGATRDQDYRAGQANTNVINQFNQANTQQRNQTNNANVGQRNDAFMYNQGLQDKKMNNQYRRADALSGVNSSIGDAQGAQAEANRQQRNHDLGLVTSFMGMGMSGKKG